MRHCICVVVLAAVPACGPSLLVDSGGSGSAGSGDDGDAPDVPGDDDEGSTPDASDDDDGSSVHYDVAAPGSEGPSTFDLGTPDTVCTATACFASAIVVDDVPAHALAIADVDGNGRDEIIAGGDDGLRVIALEDGVPTVTAIPTLGRVTALAAGRLDIDPAADIVALTDAGRVVVVEGGSNGRTISFVVSDGQRDVAFAPLGGTVPSFATVSRGGVVAMWRRLEGGWASTFFQVDGEPSTIAVGASQGSSSLVVSVGDADTGAIDTLVLDGAQLVDVASFPANGGDPLQLESGPVASSGALPDLLVLTTQPESVQVRRLAQDLGGLSGVAVVPVTGSLRAFAVGELGSMGRDVAVVDDEAGTVEICTLAVGDAYLPACTGAVLAVGDAPVAVAIGRLDDSGTGDLAIASPTVGVTVVLGD